MTENLPQPDPSLALQTWFALPVAGRNIDNLNKKLKEMGFGRVPKTTLYRWRDEAKPGHTDPEKFIARHSPTIPVPSLDLKPIDTTGIPEDLIEALGLRVLVIAKGEGLDRVENAIVKIAEAIAGKAEQIATQLLDTESETTEITKAGEDLVSSKTVKAAEAARSAVNSLAICAEAMHKVTASRTLWSLAFRNFSEGDRLSGEGAKLRAEAETVHNATRADNAKDITPGRPYDKNIEDEAVESLREVEARK